MNPRNWSVQMIEKQIREQEKLLETTYCSDRDKAMGLDLIAGLWGYKFEKTELPTDIDNAIAKEKAALEKLPEEEKGDFATIVSHLHAWLVTKVNNMTVDLATMDDAIRIGRDALQVFPENSLNWRSTRYNQDALLFDRYNMTGDPNDLDEALDFERQALSLTDHPARENMLGLLGALLSTRFQLTGSVLYLEEAIKVGYKALEKSPTRDGVAQRSNLCASLYTHFISTKRARSLDEALDISKDASELPAPTYGLSQLLFNRGKILAAKYTRAKARNPEETTEELLASAISTGQRGLSLLGEGHVNEANFMNTIGSWLGMLFKHNRSRQVLEESIQYSSNAVTLASEKDRLRPMYLSDLTASLEAKYWLQRRQDLMKESISTLDQALDSITQAVNTTEGDHPGLAERLNNAGAIHYQKYLRTEEDRHYQKAKECYAKASRIPSSPPLTRIIAGRNAAGFHLVDKEWHEADTLLEESISLLPRVATLSLTAEDQRDALREISGLASIAAAGALHAGRPAYEALTRLETARCVVSEISMRAKSDLTALYERDAALAEKYETLRDQVSRAFRASDVEQVYVDMQVLQSQRLTELTAVEDQIRRVDGFERFQLPMIEEEFLALARDGPVITFNVTGTRSDAIIADRDGIRSIPLPGLKYREAEAQLRVFDTENGRSQRHSRVPKKPNSLSAALQWLWDAAVQPVLEATHLTESKRIWWLTSGLLGRAPLHIAGNHSPGSNENALAHVVSSYISSFKALRFVRQREREIQMEKSLLLVTMSHNPYPYRDLDTVKEEAAAQASFGQAMKHLDSPSPESVLRALPNFNFIHFACHGLSVRDDPSASGLLLNRNGASAILTIADLEKIDLRSAELAYLSACSTAEISDRALQDEAIHLANSFQTLGFPHVIGTMWSADDVAAGEVAKIFYRRLFEGGVISHHGAAHSLGAARALHEATLEYRTIAGGAEGVICWGPFIHVGA